MLSVENDGRRAHLCIIPVKPGVINGRRTAPEGARMACPRGMGNEQELEFPLEEEGRRPHVAHDSLIRAEVDFELNSPRGRKGEYLSSFPLGTPWPNMSPKIRKGCTPQNLVLYVSKQAWTVLRQRFRREG